MKTQLEITFKIPRYNPGRIIMLETLKEDVTWVKDGTRPHKILKMKIEALENLVKKYTLNKKFKKLH